MNAAVNEFDFVVIGGGSAGYAGARTAAQRGLKTAIVEGGKDVGGLCILRGCMPSKTLLESSKRYRVLRHAEEFGLHAKNIGFAPTAIIHRKNRLVGEFADYRRHQLEEGKFQFIRGKAAFIDPHTIEVSQPDGETQRFYGRTFLIATGSIISPPSIPDLDKIKYLTSDDLLDLEEIPESLIILGGGAVALEMASYVRAFGSRVVILQRSPQLLRGTDREAAEALAAELRKDGIEIFTGTRLLRIQTETAGYQVTFEHQGQKAVQEGSALLNALGRKPALDGLAAAHLRIDADGKISTTLDQKTSQPHIFAAGDVCSPLDIVHIAIQQGELAARNAARLLRAQNEPLETMDYRLKLFAVFSEPQFATVGANEADLQKQGIRFLSAKHPFDDHGKSLVMGETGGFVKLIVAENTREILGASIVGSHAAELIHEIAVAMNFHATADQLAAIPHYHPTLSEIWTYPAEELALGSQEKEITFELR